MAPVLAMFQETILRLGTPAARAERARCTPVHLSIILDEFIVEHTRAESTDADADPHSPSKSAESPEPEQQVHREFLRRKFLWWYELQRERRQSTATPILHLPRR